MARKAESFYTDLISKELIDAINNDFGKAVSKIRGQGHGEVRDEVFVYFSAMAMQQVNAIADKHGITDTEALHEIYQLTRTNLIQGFRIGQTFKSSWTSS